MGGSRDRQSTGGQERSRGQTETLGVVLLLGMTIVGAVSVVAFGAVAFQDAQDSSGHESVSHAMTQFDSKAAIVALGDTDTQSVQFGGAGDGSYTVEPEAGWINVSHANGTDVEPFLNTSLGALVYSDGDVEIAYQGGGVWRKRSGGSVMVSPPEFHYRDATLILPLIRANGSASASGSIRASITNEMSSRAVFPNSSEDSYWDDNRRYQNPVSEGNVTITVHSAYYQAWAEYFRTRSEGIVKEYDNNRTVQLTLETGSVLGDFDMPNEGNSLSITGMSEEHPVDNFTVTLEADNDGQNFNNMHWSLYAEEGSQDFELHIYSPGKCQSDSYNDQLDVSVYYYNGTTSYYQGWQNSSIDPEFDDNFDVDCDDYTLTANFTGDTSLAYKEIDTTGSDNKWHFGSDISSYSIAPTTTFDEHSVDDDGDRDGMYNESDAENETMGFVGNHYFTLLGPSFDLTVSDGPGGSDTIDEDSSTGTLDYQQKGGSVITFLHVTENRIRIDFQ